MPSFMERWLNRNFDLAEEVNTIEALMKDDNSDFTINSRAGDAIVNWEFANGAISLYDFRQKSGILAILKRVSEEGHIELLDALDYFEYAYNISELARRTVNSRYDSINNNAFGRVVNNINAIVNQNGYQLKRQSNGLVYIVIKDAVADMASDIVEGNNSLDEDIFMYRHHSLSGNLVGKAAILSRMEKYCEGNIEPYITGNATLTKVKKDIGFMANHLDIRHAPRTETKPVIEELRTTGELEKWYDELYRQIISFIVLFDCSKKQKDIEELKERLGLRTQTK